MFLPLVGLVVTLLGSMVETLPCDLYVQSTVLGHEKCIIYTCGTPLNHLNSILLKTLFGEVWFYRFQSTKNGLYEKKA